MKYELENDIRGKKLTELISENVGGVTLNVIKHQIKIGEVKVNGVKVRDNIALESGDRVSLFMPKDAVRMPPVRTVYLDYNIIAVDKPVGADTEHNLVNMLNEVYGTQYYPVHRLDRNTSGLVLLAKDRDSERLLSDAIKARSIRKFYRALVYGHFDEKEFTDTAYLTKNDKKSTVRVSDEKSDGALQIITKFRVTAEFDDYSEVEVELVTGRTHQIRAHAAYLGHPILGDGKYAPRDVLEKFDYKFQQLRAVKLIFGGLKGKLSYLNGLTLQV